MLFIFHFALPFCPPYGSLSTYMQTKIFSSTMPVASSVETPKLFKGTLKEYQLKGLQWLVNCYEQVIKVVPTPNRMLFNSSLLSCFPVVLLNWSLLSEGTKWYTCWRDGSWEDYPSNGILGSFGWSKWFRLSVLWVSSHLPSSNLLSFRALLHSAPCYVVVITFIMNCRRKIYGGHFWLLHLLLYWTTGLMKSVASAPT